MDMRTHGKGFEDYLNSAIDRDVRLIRSRVHTVDTVPESDDLLIRYADESGHLEEESFDMVVLSVGVRPGGEAVELANKIGVNLTADHFVSTEPFKPVSTNVPGIFVCGGLSGPHDIGQSLVQATATASEIGSILSPEPFAAPREYPNASEAADKDPEILLAYHLCPGMAPELGAEIEGYALKTLGVKAASRVEGDIFRRSHR